MEREHKKIIIRILELAGLFALSAFLIRLGIAYLKEIWPVLLIVAVIVAGVIIGFRVYKNKVNW